jgi:hypothetical protein
MMLASILSLLLLVPPPITVLEFDRGALIVVKARPRFAPLVRAPGGHAPPKSNVPRR